MNETLFDMFERWVQGRINVCVDGILARLSRIEEFNVDDQITGLRLENDRLRRLLATETQNANNLYQEIRTLNARLTELEDRRVENAPDEQLDGFKERVMELFEDDDFRNELVDAIEYFINNSDDVCSLDDVRDILRNDVRVSLDVGRY